MEDFYYEKLSDAAAECGIDIEERHLRYMAKAIAMASAELDQAVREGLS